MRITQRTDIYALFSRILRHPAMKRIGPILTFCYICTLQPARGPRQPGAARTDEDGKVRGHNGRLSSLLQSKAVP